MRRDCDTGGEIAETVSPNISETCPACGCGGFDALHSEPGELERRQCKRCGEVWTVKVVEEPKEETMAKESFDCDLCDRKGFKHEQGLKHHKTSKHGIRTGRKAGKAKAIDLPVTMELPTTKSSISAELLGLLKQRKNQVLAQVAEIDDMIEKLGG